MVDTSVSLEDINRLFRTGVITYYMPSGKGYMRTIGKQSNDATSQDAEDKEEYKNMFRNEKYDCEFLTENGEKRSPSDSPSKEKTTC